METPPVASGAASAAAGAAADATASAAFATGVKAGSTNMAKIASKNAPPISLIFRVSKIYSRFFRYTVSERYIPSLVPLLAPVKRTPSNDGNQPSMLEHPLNARTSATSPEGSS